jgi:hypothetical protein
MHLGLVDRPFVPQIGIVPSFISRGTPHHAARETSIREGRKLCQQPVMNRSCWVLLHAPNLGHGTDYLPSPPKEGMLRFEPANS